MFRCVVFDLETIPNLEAARALLGAAPTVSDVEIRQALSVRYARANQVPAEAFIKLPMHQIVCIGALYAEREEVGATWKVTGSGSGCVDQRSERDLVATFMDSLAGSPGPRLIGFNSFSFDLPLLRYRALALSLPAPMLHGANGRNYWYRYGQDHLDLCDAFSNFRSSPPPSLAEVAALCGLPAKIGGIDGSKVEGLFRGGQIADVAAYCETDVLVTYLVFLRFSFMIGELTNEAYQQSLVNMKDFFAVRTQHRPHYTSLLNIIQRSWQHE